MFDIHKKEYDEIFCISIALLVNQILFLFNFGVIFIITPFFLPVKFDIKNLLNEHFINAMTLFYGLGNNENKYLKTKHNIGRIVIKTLAQNLGLIFTESKGCYHAKNSDFWFVYTSGFMNNCGMPLAELLKYHKVDIHTNFNLIIVQDDSDQIVGNSKLSVGGGSAGHNGIISVYREMTFLGMEQNRIWRLKIGIRPETNKLKSETFVLTKNSDEDIKSLETVAKKIIKSLEIIKNYEFDKFQKVINTKS